MISYSADYPEKWVNNIVLSVWFINRVLLATIKNLSTHCARTVLVDEKRYHGVGTLLTFESQSVDSYDNVRRRTDIDRAHKLIYEKGCKISGNPVARYPKGPISGANSVRGWNYMAWHTPLTILNRTLLKVTLWIEENYHELFVVDLFMKLKLVSGKSCLHTWSRSCTHATSAGSGNNYGWEVSYWYDATEHSN